MSSLKPFFSYYGGKYRTAPRYPSPLRPCIVEPFAGSAGYSVRHATRLVKLYDASEKVCGVWDYLIHVSVEEVLALPSEVRHVDDLSVVSEAKWLIGFWLNKASAQPHLQPSAWMRAGTHVNSFWGEAIRQRIASQVEAIRHWTVSCCRYQNIPLVDATWFVDPPYCHPSGTHYPEKVDNFDRLGTWCRSLPGQVIVCEREGATWLPFQSCPWITKSLEGRRGYGQSPEVVWTVDR